MTIAHQRLVALAASVLLAGCQAVPRPAALPPPPPPPAPAPAPAPPPAPAPALSWEEAPVLPGSWRYGQQAGLATASFGADATATRVTLACRTAPRQIELGVHGVSPSARTLTVRTSFGVLSWAGAITYPPADGPAILRMTRPVSDPGFDWIAYSRGRVSLEVDGAQRLVVPAWAEISRVLEDCRN